MTATLARLEIRPVRRLGPFELIRRLADGALGERWSAQRPGPRGPERFTVELFDGRALAIPEVRARVFDESRRAAGLRHPNIVSVHELVELDGTWALITDGFEGLTLAEFIGAVHQGGQRLNYALIAYLIGELLRGLAHAHEQRWIHGAITPYDVLLSTSGTVALGEFGLRLIAAELSRSPGAMRYMPPEQLVGGRGPSLDLFAVGGILHELLDGQLFRAQAADEATLYAAVRDGQTAALGPQHPDYPVAIESLRAGLLDPRLERRIPAARDALALLGEWPGYRPAGQELGELVRTIGGFVAEPPLREASATVLIDPSQLEPPAPAREPEFDGLPPTDEQPPDDKPPLSTILLIAGAAAVGLLFIIVGLGFALGWWGPRAKPEPELAEAEPVAAPEPEPEPEPELRGAEQTPEIDPNTVVRSEVADPLANAEQTPEVGGDASSTTAGTGTGTGTGTGSKTGAGASSKSRKTVNVTLTERHYPTLQVKIAGRVYEFDGSKGITIPAGTHSVSLRERADQPWKPAGKVTVEAGSRYVIELLKPPLVKLTKLTI